MKLNKYITEENQKIVQWGPPLWQELQKNCKQFLKDYSKTGLSKKGIWIWRGAGQNVDFVKGFKEIIPRVDRKPKDMSYELHHHFDSEFYHKFGWYARSEGVFTTSKLSEAKNYGNPYLFFPSGRYKFIWSPTIDDLYSEIDNTDLGTFGTDYYDDYRWHEEWLEIYGEGRDGHWEYEGEVVGTAGESRWSVEGNIADDVGDLFDPGLLEWIPEVDEEDFYLQKEEVWREEQEKELEEIIETYTDKDLRKAIRSGNEIMFNCDSYFLVHENYRDFLSDMINVGAYQLKLFKKMPQMTKPQYWVYNKKGQMVYNG